MPALPAPVPRAALAAVIACVGLLGAAPAAHARSYEDAVLATSSYYWRLGEPGFSPDRDLGVGSSISYGRQVATGDPGALVAGDNGSVRLFGAVADGVWESNLSLGDAPSAARGRAPFTWEVWVKPASLDANTRRIVSAENGSGGYLVGARRDALVFSRYATTPSGTTWSTITVPPPPVGRWTHIVATYDQSVMELYVDGRLAAARSSTVSLAQDWMQGPFVYDVIRLGAHSRRWLEWDGWLDEAAYYPSGSPVAGHAPSALTPALVEDHYRLATSGA